MKSCVLLILAFSISCSSVKEEYVNVNRTLGLYKRDYYNQQEFLCLNSDYTYEYFLMNRSVREILIKGKWDFTLVKGKSMIGLNEFNYSMPLRKYLKDNGGLTVPVKYSYAKKSILLRMDADDHFRDFVRIDSLSCVGNAPEMLINN